MPTNNVVPIDAEVARSIARRAIKFRWFVAGLTALWLAALIPVLVFTPLPPLVPFLVLGGLLVLAEHRFVLFGDETSMSGSIIVAIAAVFVFADTSPFAGPMLVASLGGLYLPHLRERGTSKILTNSSTMSLAALSASVARAAIEGLNGSSAQTVVAAIAFASGAYWLVNNLAVAGYVATRTGVAFWPQLTILTTSDTNVLIWCGASNAAVVASEHLVIQLAAVATCVAANAWVSSQRFTLARWKTSIHAVSIVAVSCWFAGAAGLTSTGAAPYQVAVFAGSAVAFTFWRIHDRRVLAPTLLTVVATFLAVGWLDPAAHLVSALTGVLLLSLVTFTPRGVRTVCVVTSAMFVGALIELPSEQGVTSAVLLLACVVAAAFLPLLLAAIHMVTTRRSMSLTTCAGIALPSICEISLVLGCYVVVASLNVDPFAAAAAAAAWLLTAVWFDIRRELRYR